MTLFRYFNGDKTVKALVKKRFDVIASWYVIGAIICSPLSPAHIMILKMCASRNQTAPYVSNTWFRCDPLRRSQLCKSGDDIYTTTYFYPNGWSAMILVCPGYFYGPMSSECVNPSYVRSLTKPLQQDQSGIMMHEILHTTTMGNRGATIADGIPSCYGWACLAQRAHDRVLPDFKTENLPENMANSYEFFAYEVRGSRAECTWTEWAGAVWGAMAT